MNWRSAALTVLILILYKGNANAGSLRVCAVNNNADDWKGMWAWGPIHLPAGSAFDETQNDPTTPNWKSTSGIITTSDLTLSKKKPCGSVSADAAIFPDMGWSVSPIYENGQASYYLYGVIQNGALVTSFGALNTPPADGFQAGIELYQADIVGEVVGTLNETVTLNNANQ